MTEHPFGPDAPALPWHTDPEWPIVVQSADGRLDIEPYVFCPSARGHQAERRAHETAVRIARGCAALPDLILAARAILHGFDENACARAIGKEGPAKVEALRAALLRAIGELPPRTPTEGERP